MSESSWRVVVAPESAKPRTRGAVFTVRAASADEAQVIVEQSWLWTKREFGVTAVEKVQVGDTRARYNNPGNAKPDLELIRNHVAETRHYVNGRRLMPNDTDLRSYHAMAHRRTPTTFESATEDGHTHSDPRHIQEG